MTLILEDRSTGRRRCDERCYLATTPRHECGCVCGGVNHGVGLLEAIRNTARMLGIPSDRDEGDVLQDILSVQEEVRRGQVLLSQEVPW